MEKPYTMNLGFGIRQIQTEILPYLISVSVSVKQYFSHSGIVRINEVRVYVCVCLTYCLAHSKYSIKVAIAIYNNNKYK